MSDDNFSDFSDLIPEDALPSVAIKIVCFYDRDGEELSNWSVHGDTPLHVILGLMEYAKQRMFFEYETLDELEEEVDDE